MLTWLSGSFDARPDAPRVVLATPTNEHHELGAMLAAAVAAGEGWRTLYLGPNLPAMDIVTAAERVSASVVALSVVYTDGEPTMEEIRETASRLPASTLLVIGGAAASRLERSIGVAGVRVLPDLGAFRALLGERAAEAAVAVD